MSDDDRGDPQAASRLEFAILQTIIYADIFDYPLSADEIHLRLIGLKKQQQEVQAQLQNSEWLGARTERVNGYYALRGRGEEISGLRTSRQESSARLWGQARRFGRLMAHLPFVRLVAVTGALAVDNSDIGDDIDYLIVSAPGRVWLVRAGCIVIVRMARIFGVYICPNYLLSERVLDQPKQDLFAAHELVQMVPLAGEAMFTTMRKINAWSAHFLPNASVDYKLESDAAPRGLGCLAQRLGEWLLAGRLGNRIERWERERKLRRFEAAMRKPGSAALLDAERIKGHFDDYGAPALLRFTQQLKSFGITAAEDQFNLPTMSL